MVEAVLLLGIAASVFVGFNIGGSSTGIAWGPPVGAEVLRKSTAAGLMTAFVFLGGWTVGRNVMDTLGEDVITIEISLGAGVAILFFIGVGILVANLVGVPVPTSMTTVGSIVGLGLATGTTDFATVGWILSWWLVTPVIGFWIGASIGRYIYPELSRRVQLEVSEGPLFTFDRSGIVPRVTLGPNSTWREVGGTSGVLVIGCYMAFSAGASNVPNAAAPLVSGGALEADLAIVLATAAISLGGFTIARRTMRSVGTELSDIPLLGALIVMVTAATLTTALSWIGVPISLVLGSVSTIVGLGWGRATRPIAARDVVVGDLEADIEPAALTVDPDAPAKIGDPEPEEVLDAGDLFKPAAVFTYVSMWIVGPTLSTLLAFLYFSLVPV